MPTYNRASYIGASIDSVMQQTYQYWELIIIDDGSDDNTADLLSGYSDSRIRFHKAGRIGIGGAIKNIGIRLATGNFIAFLDSDDLWKPDKLEKQVDALERHSEAGFSLTGGFNFRDNLTPVDYFYAIKEGEKCYSIFEPIFNAEIAVFAQALLFRKECLETSGYFKEENSFSDVDFIINLAWYYKAVILFEPLVFRRLHDANYITPNWEKSYHESIKMIRSNHEMGRISNKLLQRVLFRLYTNLGEKSFQFGHKRKAIYNFINAWKHKPVSLIPARKILKTVLKNQKPNSSAIC